MTSRLFQEWKQYRHRALAPSAKAEDVTKQQRAFYAGGLAVMETLSRCMSPGGKHTEADTNTVREVRQELEEFARIHRLERNV